MVQFHVLWDMGARRNFRIGPWGGWQAQKRPPIKRQKSPPPPYKEKRPPHIVKRVSHKEKNVAKMAPHRENVIKITLPWNIMPKYKKKHVFSKAASAYSCPPPISRCPCYACI